MTDKDTSFGLKPQPETITADERRNGPVIAMVANHRDSDETRIFLTPEACGLLTSAGFNVMMQHGASVDISFSDEAYAEYGVKIVSREEALKADIVLAYDPLSVTDIRKMQKGKVILGMMHPALFSEKYIKALMDHEITFGCLDNMYSHNDEAVFANIIDEIDGRAAIMYAQDFLSFTGGGKGVLLAGVPGVNPCEILIIGEGNRSIAAAKAAMDAGAMVTLMDNDVSSLQVAHSACGERITAVAIHPKVLYNKVKTADVILIGPCTRPFEFPKQLSVAMKESCYVLNFEETHPSMSVPRTVAMALSNALVNFLDELMLKNGMNGMISTSAGVQSGIVTYKGKLVDKLIGSYLSMPSVDINVMLAATN